MLPNLPMSINNNIKKLIKKLSLCDFTLYVNDNVSLYSISCDNLFDFANDCIDSMAIISFYVDCFTNSIILNVNGQPFEDDGYDCE